MIATAGAFLLGVFAWTFLEYVIHRFVGHRRRARDPMAVEHMQHHATTDYFSPAAKKLAVAVPVLGGLALLLAPLLGAAAPVLALGTGAGWFAYEVVHRLIHVRAPRGPYGRWARRHHLHHHFMSPRHNHGVTSPLWDLVFRTYRPAARVRVPGHQARRLGWLFDARGQDIASPFRDVYELASGPTGVYPSKA